jgi:hypothetical protein
MEIDSERAAKIALRNDVFRRSGGMVEMTLGVERYGAFGVSELLHEIRTSDCFTEDNDPYGEHDFGSLEWCGEKVFWKIDYYDQNLEYGEDPLSSKCRRVLTVMLASEY